MLEIQIKTSFHTSTTLCISDIVRSELRKKFQTCALQCVLRSVVLTSDQKFHGAAILGMETDDITEVFELQSSYRLTKVSGALLSHKYWHTLTLKATIEKTATTTPYGIIIQITFEPMLAEDPT